jgi:hypothetical protein
MPDIQSLKALQARLKPGATSPLTWREAFILAEIGAALLSEEINGTSISDGAGDGLAIDQPPRDLPFLGDPIGTAYTIRLDGVLCTTGQAYLPTDSGRTRPCMAIAGFAAETWQLLIAQDRSDVRRRQFEGDEAAFRIWYARLQGSDLYRAAERTVSDAEQDRWILRALIRVSSETAAQAIGAWLAENVTDGYIGHRNPSASYRYDTMRPGILFVELASEASARALAAACPVIPGAHLDAIAGGSGAIDPVQLDLHFSSPALV